MSAKTGDRAGRGKRTGKRRSAAAAAGALLVVPAVAAGEPVYVTADEPANVALARGAGGGLPGLTDPSEVSADGSLPESAQLGSGVLAMAGNPGVLAFGPGTVPSGPLGIPGTMLDAYMRAAQTLNTTTPGCHLEWSLLASIGRIESNHARGGRVDAHGTTATPILGPVLNGGGFAAISDTDGGRYDGDNRWDRAVGPMQFIPSTWKGYASDGNGDGETNPNNIYDATVGAGKYLCSGGMDMANPANRRAAVWRYNHSDSYVATVLSWADAYAKGVTPVPTTPVSQIQQLAAPSPGPNPPAQGMITPPTTTTPPPGSTTTAPSSTSSTTTDPTSSTTTTTDPTTTTTTTTTTDPTTTTTTPTCPTEPTPTTEPTPPTSTTPDPCAPDTTTPAPTTTTTTSGQLGSAVPTSP
ncbi:lytic transglycosylase domain-containing protein [Actinokineospora sp. HUAS TT18]|uniref:lytic transglycosylase domain-containing protein n=1 Tax=Actinokineospora sp. HUAS TT18 TaxID=3447451 RepID=UPI003F528B35